jgi:hypothetical protein
MLAEILSMEAGPGRKVPDRRHGSRRQEAAGRHRPINFLKKRVII